MLQFGIIDDIWKFFQGLDWKTVTFITALVLIALCIVFLVVTFVTHSVMNKRFLKYMKRGMDNSHLLTVQSNDPTVSSFPIGDMSKKTKETMISYLSKFSPSDRLLVKEWFDAILDGKEVPAYFIASLWSEKKGKTTDFLLIKVTNANPIKGIAHFESRVIERRKPDTRFRARATSVKDVAESFKADGSHKGMTFCFTLSPKKLGSSPVNLKKWHPPVAVRRLFFDKVGLFARGNQKFLEISDNEAILVNFDITDETQAIVQALEITQYVNKSVLSNGRKDYPHEVKVGIVRNEDFSSDAVSLIAEARHMASLAHESDLPVAFHKPGLSDYSRDERDSYKSEVERIISERKIAYLFRPVFDVQSLRPLGYRSKAVPINTSFSTINELKNYAFRGNDEKNLFAAIGKNVVSRFVSERGDENSVLFYRVQVNEMKIATHFFSSHKQAAEAKISLLLKENDIISSLEEEDVPTFLNQIAALKAKGFQFSLLISGQSLRLDDTIYGAADCFFVDFSRTKEGRGVDTKMRTRLHALVEKLLKYKKPIVADSLPDWDAIELIVGSGIMHISSDAFAPYEPMIKPAPEKSLKRIKQMMERK